MNYTKEQQKAIELAKTGKSLKIEAFAGCGKTASLLGIANELSHKQGSYIAFNKVIATEAGRKFSNNVNCQTAHSMAYRAVGSSYRPRLETRLTGKMVADQFGLTNYQILDDQTLTAAALGSLIISFVTHYTQSGDADIGMQHAPYSELIVKSADDQIVWAVKRGVMSELLPLAKDLWNILIDKRQTLPITHDVYLKLWSLNDPVINADFILFDEAQDASGVMLSVLQKQSAQVIWVGDRYQSIYSWRGAVNAMELIDTDHTTHITQSFRFGDAVAQMANSVMQHQIGYDMPIKGFNKINSNYTLEEQSAPNAVLCRTNAQCIASMAKYVAAGKKVTMVGDIYGMINTVKDASGLLADVKPVTGALSVFNNRNEFYEYVDSQQGADLRPIVNLIKEHGSKQMLSWLYAAKGVTEQDADIFVSTAHRAKGREWHSVQLTDDFLDPKQDGWNSEQANLLYVAVTRAQHTLDVSRCSAVKTAVFGDSDTISKAA